MYKLVTKFEDLGNLVFDIQRQSVAGFDIEATGLDPFIDKVTLIQLKLGDMIYLFNTVKLGYELTRYVCQLLRDNPITLVGHGLSYDIKMIRSNYGEYLVNVYDTMIAEIMTTNGLSDADRYPSLKDVVEKYCNTTLDKSVRENFIGNFSGDFTEQDYTYAALDVHYLIEIMDAQTAILETQKQLRVLELENKLVPVVASMEFNGIKVDRDKWLSLSADSLEKVKQLEIELKSQIVDKIIQTKQFNTALDVVTELQLVDKAKLKTKKLQRELVAITELSFIRDYIMNTMNLGSPQQMLAILTKIYKVPVVNTNEKTLDKHLTDYPILKTLLDFREHKKKVDSFGESMIGFIHPKTGRVHARFNQLGARTGRFSGSAPNLFNIPREQEYRDPFVAEPRCAIIATDFAQEELRLMGATFKISRMITAFNNGIDLHLATASGLYGVDLDKVTKEQRSRGKSLNFAVGYGSTEFGLYKNFGIPKQEGRELLRKYFDELYPEYTTFKEIAGKRILQQRWSTTLLGRKRFFAPAKILYATSWEKEREEASIIREGINTIIQGTGADIIKESLVRLFLENPFGDDKFKIILQVYDEILVEVAEEIKQDAQEFIKHIMLETEEKYLRGVVKAEVDSKAGHCWLH